MKESSIQRVIETFLQYQENMGKLVYIKNNSGALITQKEGYKSNFIRFGKKGSPDFFVFMPKGKVIHMETKTDTGKQNENQKEYQKRIEKLGHFYAIVRGIEDVEKLIT